MLILNLAVNLHSQENEKYINVKMSKEGADAKRDPVYDGYFCRFIVVLSSLILIRKFLPRHLTKNLANKWTPVDMYVGGKEHSVMHLLYEDFFHKIFA